MKLYIFIRLAAEGEGVSVGWPLDRLRSLSQVSPSWLAEGFHCTAPEYTPEHREDIAPLSGGADRRPAWQFMRL